MKKTYQIPEADMLLFRPAQDLAVTWTDLNSGAFDNQPQDGAVFSDNDIVIQL